jgi:hypothetical protein
MTTPNNQNFNPGEDGREASGDARASHYTPDSLFVASLIEALSQRESASAQVLARDLVELEPLTSDDLSKIIRGMNHRDTIAEVLESVLSVLRPETPEGFVRTVPEVLPALVALAEKVVLSDEPYNGFVGDQLVECIAIAAEVIGGRFGPCDAGREKISRDELETLRRICQRGSSERDGYWPSVVLMCVLDPSPQSIFHLDQAIEQVEKSVTPDDLILVSVRRAVTAVASSHFAYCLEWIAAHPDTSRNKWIVAQAILGLCEQAAFHGKSLIRALVGGSSPDVAVACTVCMFIGQDERFGLADALRSDLSEVLRSVARQARQLALGLPALQTPALETPIAQMATRALLHMTRQEKDILEARSYLEELLSLGQTPTPEMAHSYAVSLARFENRQPRRPVIPHPDRSTQTDRSEVLSDEISQRLASTATRYVTPRDAQSLLEGFAYDLITKSPSSVRSACESLREELCVHDLTPRPEESLKFFASPKDALGFARRFNFIVEREYYDVAAALLPELISAIDVTVCAEDGRVKGRLLRSVLESVEQLAYSLATRPYLQDFASRRLSSADKSLLETLPARTIAKDVDVPLELSLASLGLRMVIDPSCEWQRELFTLWRECPKKMKREADASSLPFFSVIAERYRPGSAWETIRKGSVWSDSPGFFRDLCYGLLGDPGYPEAICTRVELNSGEEISKMFALAQGLRDHFTNAQRERVLKVARDNVEDLGALSIDSVLTMSVLSTSLEDARRIMALPAPGGVDSVLHHLTCADSVARILRNIRNSKK